LPISVTYLNWQHPPSLTHHILDSAENTSTLQYLWRKIIPTLCSDQLCASRYSLGMCLLVCCSCGVCLVFTTVINSTSQQLPIYQHHLY